MGEIKIQARGGREFYNFLTELRKIRGAAGVREALWDWATHELDPAIQEVLAGEVLHRRTGTLARETYVKDVTASGSTATVAVNTTIYGPVHEFGAVIKPRRRKWLTVPLADALTPAGALRYSAPEWKDYLGKTFLVKKDGKLFIVGRRNKKLLWLFVLKKEVRIPARRWFSKAVDRASEKLADYAHRHLQRLGK